MVMPLGVLQHVLVWGHTDNSSQLVDILRGASPAGCLQLFGAYWNLSTGVT